MGSLSGRQSASGALQSTVSRSSVIVSLLVAVGLTVVSIFTLRPSDSAAVERQSVLELDPSRATALSVTRSDAGGEGGAGEIRVERGRLPGQWLVRSGQGAGEEGGAGGWPIAAERMRAALRVLAELRGRPVDEPLPEGAATLTIEREGVEGGDPLVVRIAPPALGGRRLVEVAGGGGGSGGAGVYEIEDWLHEAMVTSGPLHWRDKSAMPGVSVEASRIALISGGNRLTLSRAGGRWAMTAPVGARADTEAVEALLGLLARTQISRFYDEPPADDIAGLDEPLAQVRVERDVQIPAGAEMRRATESVTLTVGGPIDATTTALFARVTIESSLEGAPRGEALVAVSAQELNRINPMPNVYVAPQAVGVPASEIGGLELARADAEAEGGALLERTRGGWDLKRIDAESGVAVSDARSEAIGEALRTFCEAPALAILIEPPQGYEAALSVELQSLGGSPLEIIEVGSLPAPQQTGVERFFIIRAGQVYRAYESRTLTTLDLLAGMLEGLEASPAAAGTDDPAPEKVGDLEDKPPPSDD
jgi:hypothetical protein